MSVFLPSWIPQRNRKDDWTIQISTHSGFFSALQGLSVFKVLPTVVAGQRTTCFRATPRPGGRKSSRFLRSRSFFWVRGSASLGVGPGPAVKARTVRFRAGPGIVPSSSNLTALVLAWLQSWKHLWKLTTSLVNDTRHTWTACQKKWNKFKVICPSKFTRILI